MTGSEWGMIGVNKINMRTITKLIRNGIKLKRANRPERIRQAIVRETGERIFVVPFSGIRYAYWGIDIKVLYFDHHITVLDTPEEGD